MYAPGHTRGRLSVSLSTPFSSSFPSLSLPPPSALPSQGHQRGARSISISNLPPSSRRTLPPDLLLLLVCSGSLLAVSAHITKLWLVERDPGAGVGWTAIGVCCAQALLEAALGGVSHRGRMKKDSPVRVNAVKGLGSTLLHGALVFGEVLCAVGMFSGLSATETVLVTQFVQLASLVPSIPSPRLLLAPLLLLLLSTLYPPLPLPSALLTYTCIAGFSACIYLGRRMPASSSGSGGAALVALPFAFIGLITVCSYLSQTYQD
ncbi:hypothetical protein CALVIDRAFT_20818 [Calocera viscosa TUFC12733]|uniref:Transmembrane protein n=1 Tax=Calocera viscosa (strain TUFC12733) TaxID=1330018 RepID=A0A167SFV3_CALVF|nr:hypothetical protein CALVIDRAFT_20818 [Calocera viscosa TUFC12733]